MFAGARTSERIVAGGPRESLTHMRQLLAPVLDADAVWRQHHATQRADHRPLPTGPWVLGQTWERLLFAHWPVPAAALRPAVPPELPIDTFDGMAWIGVTPFHLRGLRARVTPPLPFASRFPELNVRTYTTVDGEPGIRFLSLDAASAVAVAVAQRTYRLPYHLARMRITAGDRGIAYRSRRVGSSAELRCEYGPAGSAFQPRPGSLEHWLTERYCLYVVDRKGRVQRAYIHHEPWRLQPAWASFAANSMTRPFGIDLPAQAPLLHFAKRQDVVTWPLRRV
jgi:uncharacterized protein YqjF (DUF2071 family)